jgi:adenosine deaminase
MNRAINRRTIPLLAVAAALLLAGCLTNLPPPAVVYTDPLEAIRHNKTALRYFFATMPKGADLHNHLTGAAYAETYFNIAVNANMYLDTKTFRLYRTNPGLPGTIRLRSDMPTLHTIRLQAIDHWSVRNYNHYAQTQPPDEFFFGRFGVFDSANNVNEYLAEILRELRTRARDEHVSYLEIMLTSPAVNKTIHNAAALNNRLTKALRNRQPEILQKLMEETWQAWETDTAIQNDIEQYTQLVADIHKAAEDTAPEVVSRYQAYCVRNNEPAVVFAQLYISFKACQIFNKRQTADNPPLLVGVNIVSQENGETALRDFWGHMEMFRFLKGRVPAVKTSMHAGELSLGLVPPEDLHTHIHSAIFTAGADRIGHGVDIAFEIDAPATLDYMAKNNIPVEINLTSNEFILGIKDDEHPIMLYHEHKVPIVLSTDDAGIFRTDLTEQYTLAARRYPQLTYWDFKRFAFNSIRYAFLPDAEKSRLTTALEQNFETFERTMNIKTPWPPAESAQPRVSA